MQCLEEAAVNVMRSLQLLSKHRWCFYNKIKRY